MKHRISVVLFLASMMVLTNGCSTPQGTATEPKQGSQTVQVKQPSQASTNKIHRIQVKREEYDGMDRPQPLFRFDW